MKEVREPTLPDAREVKRQLATLGEVKRREAIAKAERVINDQISLGRDRGVVSFTDYAAAAYAMTWINTFPGYSAKIAEASVSRGIGAANTHNVVWHLS